LYGGGGELRPAFVFAIGVVVERMCGGREEIGLVKGSGLTMGVVVDVEGTPAGCCFESSNSGLRCN
jgi:hypothetical protein